MIAPPVGFETGPQGGGFSDLAPTLDTRCKDGPIRNQLGMGVVHPQHGDAIASALRRRNQSRGVDSDCTDTLIAHSLRGEGFDASEDGTGRGTPLAPVAFDTAQLTSKSNRSNPQQGDPCHTLHSGNTHHVAIPINMQAAAKNGKKSPNGYGVGEPGDPAPTLGANDQHAVACFKGGQGSQARSVGYSEHLAPTLPSADSGSNRTPTLMQGMSVRRLTPRECERLQGFPDDYTLVPYRGKPAADGPRYKALGNSMAVPVMRWIGERIQMVERLRPEEAE